MALLFLLLWMVRDRGLKILGMDLGAEYRETTSAWATLGLGVVFFGEDLA